MRRIYPLLLLIVLPVFAAEIAPQPRAHAHNDYEHARPLLDALERGFCNVEADIYLVEGRLLVAHDRKDVKSERTLSALYLDPLRERVRRNGGRVFPQQPSFVLLIDVKSEAAATYAALHAVLTAYADMLTSIRAGVVVPGAVTVVVSGNRAVNDIAAQSVRYAAVDGRADDLDTNPPAALVPWVSENWRKAFKWNWQGPIPAADRTALQSWVERAHRQGRKVRFWNTPDRPEAWTVLLEAGVDLIGTDDLAGLQRFLVERSR
ncbi:phosphatidylinositol-specific phospholipase C/glycerophosphodiester phosphodiesterase family protein [Horticoccus sp. 23ND18S-11]|uniref:phosphatidylinositol-specific phospholipase C/glycerophosphodiester phosphodiesterase family protein n=1 Tax=Horticoccus sp. 23ND18S-11 TaxID=3391832 RepID=UPI0039C9E526